jgi:hexosaminidase
MDGSVKVTTDPIIEIWQNGLQNPVAAVQQGSRVINANGDMLYYDPHLNGGLDLRALYNHWTPNIFDLNDPSVNLKPDDPHLLGGMFCDWNDDVGGVSDLDVFTLVKPAMPVMGQKMWGGSSTPLSYDAFEHLVGQLGPGPNDQPPK